MGRRRRRVPVVVWPLLLVWWLARAIVKRIGRTPSLVAGAVMVVVGLLLSATIVGAIVGIPLVVLGVAVLVNALTKRGSSLTERWT